MTLEIKPTVLNCVFGFFPVSALPEESRSYLTQKNGKSINMFRTASAIPGVNVVTGLFLAVLFARACARGVPGALVGLSVSILRAALGPVFLFVDVPLYIYRCNQAKNKILSSPTKAE